MKIERIEPFLVDRFTLVRVYTDQGIVGNGEAGLWAHQRLVYEAVRDLSEYFIGKDPTRIEHHFQVISRDTHFMGAVLSAALSAIDIALWDIMAKSVNLPVYALLGGKCRDKVRVFANVFGDTPEAFAASAQTQVEQGYESLRTTPFLPGWEQQSSTKTIGDAVAIVAAIRESIGYEVDLGLEIHRNLMPDEAVILAQELLPYRILYYEDPLMPQSNEAVEYVANKIHMPIATGERFYNLQQFKDLLDRKSVSLIRPDLSLAGGYTQGKKIAALAEAAFVGVFPHLMGSPVNIAAFVQWDAATPNFVLHENLIAADQFNEIVDYPLEREGGYIKIPNRPGIGLEINEEKLVKFPYRPKPITGNFRGDGSVIH
ncbi:MAG: mandelate racemase/muconate lactonizing enzyme family protein [Chloroflexota bacterium]